MKPARIIVGFFCFLLLLLIALPLAASPTALGAMLTQLPFGWWHFLKRNVPQLSCDWGLVATGIICSLGVLVLGNSFMKMLFRHLQEEPRPNNRPERWRWSWSLAIYAIVWILFSIAFGATGMMRHTTWLLKSNQPWFEERLSASTELRMASGTVEQLMAENEEDLQRTRKSIVAERRRRGSRNPFCEDFDAVLYANGSNQVGAYLIIPRNAKLLAKGNFAAWTADEASASVRPLSQLPETIAKMEARYRAETKR